MIDDIATERQRREFRRYLSQPAYARTRRVNARSIPEVLMVACKKRGVFLLGFSAVFVLIWDTFSDVYNTPLSFLGEYVYILSFLMLLEVASPALAQWIWPQTFPLYGEDRQFLRTCWRAAKIPDGLIKDAVIIALADAAFSLNEATRHKRLNLLLHALDDIERKARQNVNQV